jgi:iron complex outermembrane recepter protein
MVIGFIAVTGVSLADSLYYELPLIEITSSRSEAIMRLPAAEGILSKEELEQHAPAALLPAVNNIAGVRMEERSPGSYRFSIRGSLLRSPFGVRNVKFYLSDWVFTDAGGNTYLNSIDISALNAVRILKGPASGLFGANTGGVVILDPFASSQDSLSVGFSLSGGSFGLVHEHAKVRKQFKKASFQVQQSFQRSNGYREHSAMSRHFFQVNSRWQYKEDAYLKGILFFSDLDYQTPGGLTLEQMEKNPRASRPATAVLPGAAEQQAGIRNRTVFSGLSHHKSWQGRIKQVTALSGAYTDFQNPFITNYEHRKEANVGLRSYVEADLPGTERLFQRLSIGGEWQQGFASVENFGNRGGAKDTMQASDRLRAAQGFLFGRYQADINKRLLMEASLSLNFFGLRFRTVFPGVMQDFDSRQFRPQVMPRLSASYLISEQWSVRAIVNRGYSVPTLAEIRASDNRVNTILQPEKGFNYEGGIRFRDYKDVFLIDANFFVFQLKDAIVRKLDDDGDESFSNAGSTLQPGAEMSVRWKVLHAPAGAFIQQLELRSALTYNRFRFNDYVSLSGDFSGNKLPGSPDWVLAASANINFRKGINFYVQYYYTGESSLTDANTVSAEAYHILQTRIAWTFNLRTFQAQVFAGGDNLLNQTYSLGNDLNAFGARFYNPAAAVNFYVGLKINWKQKFA